MTSLKHAAVRGTFWSGLSTLFSRGLRFCITILLARLLVPADFGLVAMGLLVMDVAELLSDVGLAAALIQRKQVEPQHLTTAFWANLAMGGLLWSATMLLAPAAAVFFRNASVEPILRIMAINFLLAPIGSIPWVLLNRQLRFKELMIAQSLATAVRGSVSLLLAWSGAGVWSLVWGPLAGTVTGSIVNWSFCRWRPTFHWSWPHFKALFRFGKNVFGEKLLGYFSANSDNIIAGRVLGASTLGFYNFAYQIPHLPETHLAPIVNRVLFPVLSQVQDDRARLRRGYLQSVRWIALVAAPCAVGLFVASPELIPVVYGAPWRPVVVPLQILCAAGLIHALTSPVWTVQLAVGRSDIGVWWNAATLPLTIGTLIASARWGIVGIATAMLSLSLVLSLAIQHISNRLIGLTWRAWLSAVRVPLAASGVAGAAAALTRTALLAHELSAPLTLIAVGVVGSISYGLAVVGQDRGIFREASGLIRRPSPARSNLGARPMPIEVVG